MDLKKICRFVEWIVINVENLEQNIDMNDS